MYVCTYVCDPNTKFKFILHHNIGILYCITTCEKLTIFDTENCSKYLFTNTNIPNVNTHSIESVHECLSFMFAVKKLNILNNLFLFF